MGAPSGNCNAAKNKTKCRAEKGWYGRSGSRKHLKGTFEKQNLVPYLSKAWGRTPRSKDTFNTRLKGEYEKAVSSGNTKHARYLKKLSKAVTDKWAKSFYR